MADYDDEDDEESGEGGGLPTELIASYLAFGRRAIARRKWLVIAVFVFLGSIITTLAILWPKTYHCESRLMAARNQVLLVRGDDDALRGASDTIMRHENLEAIVTQTDLVKHMREHRPFMIRMKDGFWEKLRGPPSEAAQRGTLVWTLETRLYVVAEGSSLTLAVDWADAQASAMIIDAAQNNFLETRHVAEISTIAEYISILEGHATKLRNEVDQIAAQIRQIREEKRREAKEMIAKAKSEGTPHTTTSIIRRTLPRPKMGDVPDEEQARLRVLLEAKRRTISELEDYRSRRLLEMQNKLQELQGKYTQAHPAILDTRQNIATLSQPSPQVAALKSEVAGIEADIKRRGALLDGTVGAAGGVMGTRSMVEGGSATSEPLPSDIMSLLQESDDELDPAVGAQFRYAIDKYMSLRGQIGSARVDLDTAQAAFKYRYKVVVPSEVPSKATKPKVPGIIGGGLFASLVLGLIVALLAELRAGKIVETWQVQQIALPLLGELKFPPPPNSPSNE
jgi:peptidoglycan hydrolase CwlO-like protein